MKVSNSGNSALQEAITWAGEDNALEPEKRKKVVGTLVEAPSPLEFDEWIYRLVVIFLGVTVLVVAVGGMTLVAPGKASDMPTGIVALGSVAAGALAGLLAPSPGRRSGKEE